MPSVFENTSQIKVIEYGQHADDGIDLSPIKAFFQKFFA